MMKSKRGWLLYPLIILMLLFSAIPVNADMPAPPHAFYGTLTIGGSPAPVGTVVKAKVGGVEYGSITTTVAGQYGGSGAFDAKLSVSGDITAGATISFYANDAVATQTYAYSSGAVTELNLTVSDSTAPTVTINQASGQADPTNASPINFTVVFSESVSDFATGDVTLSGTAGATTGTVTGSGTTYTVAVSGMTASGTVIASIAAGVAHDAASNPNTASTGTDNTVTYDATAPTVTINQASGQVDPTGTSPINFTVVFSESVSDFATGDVTLSGTAGATTGTVTGSGTTYNVAASGMTASGTVIASIAAGVAHDAAGNATAAFTSTDNTVTYDTTILTVTINQAASQADPASASPINFTVVFSASVSDFATGDVTLSGTAGATTATVTGSGTTYNVAVSGMTASGTVIGTLAAGVAHDATSHANTASTGTDNTVTYDATAPTVTINQASGQADPASASPINFTVVFSESVSDFATGDVTLSGTAGATTATVTGSGTTYTVAVSGMTANGTVIASIAAGKAHDAAGNANTASTSTDNTVTYDTAILTVTINQASGQADPANASPINFTVVFSASVSDFATGDVTLSGTAGATTATVTGSGTTYNVAVSGMTTDGTVIASIAAGAAHDATSHANTASTGTDNTVTYSVVVGSLEDAVDAVPSGGTVTLGSGTYTGDVIIDKPLTITGTTGTIIHGGIRINPLVGSNVTIENLTITDYTDYGIWIEEVKVNDVFIIRNNVIQGVTGSLIGIKVDKVTTGGTGNLTIEKNTISGNATAGIKLLADVQAATIQFNDFTSNTAAGVELVAGGTATATKNWWGDISGPKQTTTNPRGVGNTVTGNASYQPWLTRQFATVQTDNIAYFGYAWVSLSTGWNILSTPIALDPGADTWGEYVALGNPDLHIHGTSPAYSFNAATGQFVALTSDYQLKASDAIYVRMTQADIAPILYSPNTSVPSKQLYAGWNLVSLANLDDMSVRTALTSVYKVPGDLTGYSQVVSPSIGNQTAWMYIRDAAVEPTMAKTKGYWVFMVNAPTSTTLAGFTFTPMSP